MQGRFVDFSTSEIFGPMAYQSDEEDHAVSGSAGEARWTYAVSKLAGEHLARAYHAQYALPTVTLRPFNVYGPGQQLYRIVPRSILFFLLGKVMELHGGGQSVRSFIHINDV